VGQGRENAAFIWSIANLLRGPDKPAEYGPVILEAMLLDRVSRWHGFQGKRFSGDY